MVDVSDPLTRPDERGGVGLQLREARAWLVDLLFEREGGAEDKRPPSIASRSCRLANGRRVACVSLTAGCGTTTVATLVAQRSGGAGARVRLLDLDLAAPSLALLAGERTPTLIDALASASPRARRWGSVEVVFGAERDPGPEVAGAVVDFVRRSAAEAAVVIDAGSLAAPVSQPLLRACDTILYVTTPRTAHLHAALRARPLLEDLAVRARLVVMRSAPEAAEAIAREVRLPLAGCVPEDPFLARDEFRVRAETARAIDSLCATLA